MPSVREVQKAYDQLCVWPEQDDVLSAAWGTSAAQWYCGLLPRIHEFVPTGTILEIGPGSGRWTQFLRRLCTKLIVVDLSFKSAEACKKRFQSDRHVVYHTNDGTSLEMIPDRSVDFVFSFDALVYAEADVIEHYLEEISRKLTEKGGGFIHHSNLGALPILLWFLKWCDRLRVPRRNPVERQEQWRAHSMTADRFRSFCMHAGLACIRQEIVNAVGTKFCIDCLSTFVMDGSKSARECVTVRNANYTVEANRARRLAKVYMSNTSEERAADVDGKAH